MHPLTYADVRMPLVPAYSHWGEACCPPSPCPPHLPPPLPSLNVIRAEVRHAARGGDKKLNGRRIVVRDPLSQRCNVEKERFRDVVTQQLGVLHARESVTVSIRQHT